MVFSATRSLCRKLSKRYDVNASYLFSPPPPSPFFFLSLINLKLRGRIVPFDRAIHVHPLSISLAISFFASLAPLLDAISLDRNRGWDLSYKNWQELVLLAPLSLETRFIARYMHLKEVINGEAIFCEKKFSLFPRCTFHSNQSRIPRTSLILVYPPFSIEKFLDQSQFEAIRIDKNFTEKKRKRAFSLFLIF